MADPNIINAVVDVLRGKLSQRKAAVKHDVPRSTLRDYIRRSKVALRVNQPNEGSSLVSDPTGVYKRILVISDQHAPYTHPDALGFLKSVKKKYRPDRVVNIGDELDYHAMSYHDADCDLDSAGVELQKGREWLQELAVVFPQMDLVESNHGSMAYRKAKSNGVPRHLLQTYRASIFGEKDKDGEIYYPKDRGSGWVWHPSLILNTPHEPVNFHHGKKANVSSNVLDDRMCFVQGHHHSKADISYISTPNALLWGMTVGCLINDKSYAFAYNKIGATRPIISVGIIIDGFPRLLPIPLDTNGKWTGVTP
ncbi:phosphoesterase [bacterium]|nr:phosphoesterase [bacterium]